MNPITPNCKCVIVNSVMGNNGIEVTALRYIDSMTGREEKKLWLTDTRIMGSKGRKSSVIPEFNLKRIDDFDLSTDGKRLTTWQETGFEPNKLGVK